MTDTQTREARTLDVRAAVSDDAEARTVTGLGVPYGEIITIWGEREMLAPGAVEADGAKLFARHSTAIGMVTAHEDTEAGWSLTAKFSRTAAADEAYQLARDGVYDGLSIGFTPLEWHVERDDQGELIVYDRVRVREVSVVPFPAYPSARVTDVRADPTSTTNRKETPAMGDENNNREADDLRELREQVEDVQRSLSTIQATGLRIAEPARDERSGGAYLGDLVRGDENTRADYADMLTRAWEGGTTDDGILTPQYVGDTIRLIEDPDPLSQIFATGALPSKGLQLDYGVLGENTIDVAEQVNEADQLVTGNIGVGLDHATIRTYGGVFGMTRQEIERTTNIGLLDLHWRALALAARKRKAAVLRAEYARIVAENAANPDRVVVVADPTTYLDWVSGIVDAAEHFIDLGLGLDAMLVDKTVFKTLIGLNAKDGRPLMSLSGTGANTVGTIAPKALGGNLASVEVRVNLRQSAPGAAFVNGDAIRQYNAPIVELEGEHIGSLTKQFGMYYYAALAPEIPQAIVPVVAAAPAPIEG